MKSKKPLNTRGLEPPALEPRQHANTPAVRRHCCCDRLEIQERTNLMVPYCSGRGCAQNKTQHSHTSIGRI